MFKVIPEPNVTYYCNSGLRMAFDPTKSPHYNVIYGEIVRDTWVQIHTYSSKTGNWSLCGHQFPHPLVSFKGVYWNDAICWLNYDSSEGKVLKLDIMNDHPVLTALQTPLTLDGRVHNQCYLFESRGCLVLVGKDNACSWHFTIYEKGNVYSEWLVKYIVNLDDIIKPFPEMWSMCCISRIIYCIVLEEREEDSFLVIELDKKNHFQERFHLPIGFPSTSVVDMDNHLSRVQSDFLEHDFSRDEIKRAVWDCGGDRTPGPDRGEKMTWVNWKKCLASKKMGGLGIESIFALNVGLLFKWVWRFFCNPPDLWIKVIKEFYGPHGGIYSDNLHCSSQSPWAGILSSIKAIKAKEIDLLSLCVRKLGNGASIQFWNDVWLGDTTLKLLFPMVFLLETDRLCSVANCVGLLDWSSVLRRTPKGHGNVSVRWLVFLHC
nr:RNA-directed DNA polymerase, eukaryota, reverse transcriptase zinc-binding domain protein [Tanacetum cinerariifolium]